MEPNICKNCGTSYDANLKACPVCGMPNLNKPNDNQNNGQSAYNPNYNSSADFGRYQQTNLNCPEFTVMMIVNVILTLCMCNVVSGGLAIAFTILMNKAYKMGDMQNYMQNKKVVKVVYIITLIMYMISIAFTTLLMVLNW